MDFKTVSNAVFTGVFSGKLQVDFGRYCFYQCLLMIEIKPAFNPKKTLIKEASIKIQVDFG